MRAQFAESDRDRDDGGPRRIVGYVARNKVKITLRELGKAGAIVDSLFKAGANEVRGPHFGIKDSAPVMQKARQAAARAAMTEAQEYADAFHMRVARVLKISESEVVEPEAGVGYIVVTGSRIPPTPIEPGEIEATVTIAVDYALVPR